jgi:phosphoribosylformylglycinamidine synthase subunit PurL
VLECASNLACVGAEPLGVTNNLNFGNPEKPHVAWQLSESVRALADACRALGTPVVGGNVSLYNEGESGPIYPTPVIGMVGELPDARRAAGLAFRTGLQVALVGPFAPALAASELAKLWGQALPDGLDAIDLDAVLAAQHAVREGVRAGSFKSAHDIAEGGLAVALAECCVAGSVGAELDLTTLWAGRELSATAGLFGEGAGGFIVTLEDGLGLPRELERGVPVVRLGSVGGSELRISGAGAGADPTTIAIALEELSGAHDGLSPLFP